LCLGALAASACAVVVLGAGGFLVGERTGGFMVGEGAGGTKFVVVGLLEASGVGFWVDSGAFKVAAPLCSAILASSGVAASGEVSDEASPVGAFGEGGVAAAEEPTVNVSALEPHSSAPLKPATTCNALPFAGLQEHLQIAFSMPTIPPFEAGGAVTRAKALEQEEAKVRRTGNKERIVNLYKLT